MKKLINDPRYLVRESLEGLTDLDPGLALMEVENVVVRSDVPADAASRPIALLSGGGSGHEPAHAGYVGAGMLTAAVAGDVFTSPSVDAIQAAISAAAGPAGAILIVKNYTGDRLNFGLAADLAAADGIPVETVVVADDVALGERLPREQRRGIAGTVLVHKIAGAAVASGASLQEAAALGRAAAADLATVGVGLGACILPSTGLPGFELGIDEVELGLGIHGEKGLQRIPIESADRLVDRMLDIIFADAGYSLAGRRVALLVNGLGGTPPLELLVVARRAVSGLRDRGLEVGLAWHGSFMTALEMPGCSITVVPLDAQREELLRAPTSAPAWRSPTLLGEARRLLGSLQRERRETQAIGGAGPDAMKGVVDAVAAVLAASEAELADLDARSGDGDLGASMARAAAALRALPAEAYNNPSKLLKWMGEDLRRALGGSSGPFYAAALLRAAAVMGEPATPAAQDWARAFEAAVSAIRDLGGANPGDRTMVDALLPAQLAFSDALAAGLAPSVAAVHAAEAAHFGAAATAAMTPRLGRAAYMGDRALGAPDAGARAVAIWLRVIADKMTKA
jgi:dihydroxyacetone kinase